MISTVTTTTTEISSLQIMIFFLFIGILYHYLKTSEYVKIIKSSVLIGGVLGVLLGLWTSDIMIGLEFAAISIIPFGIGGVIAVWLKNRGSCKKELK